MAAEPIVGIDLGTTYTSVAAVRGNRVALIADEAGAVQSPSVIGFPSRGQIVVGGPARERLASDPTRTIASPKRLPVASWYLRLRDPAGHDPMWGLVRVETADMPVASSAEITARADQLSRWILAEVAPLALPDGRWDKMVYGVRDCEEFLRAVT